MSEEKISQEKNLELALQAQRKFNSLDYNETSNILQQISTEISPEKDHHLAHNIVLNEYALNKKTISELENCLRGLQASIKNYFLPNSNGGLDENSETKADSCPNMEGFYDFKTDRESSFIRYNLASLKFREKQYADAVCILESLIRSIECLDEAVAIHICFLYIDVLLHMLRNPGSRTEKNYLLRKAQFILSTLDKLQLFHGESSSQSNSNNTGSETNEMGNDPMDGFEYRFRCHLYKAKVYVLQNNAKLAKKEIKSAVDIFQKELKSRDVETSKTSNNLQSLKFTHLRSVATQNAAALYLKANFEYTKENYGKCIKLLASCQRGSVNEAIFYNNMGAIHSKMKHPKVAQRYFCSAYESCRQSRKKASSKDPSINIAPDVDFEILYNTGLQLLMNQKYEDAFHAFRLTSTFFFSRAKLWLRMGECCLAYYEAKVEERAKNQKNSLIRGVVGSGSHRRVLLSIPEENEKEKENENSVLSLSNALKYFRNALSILKHPVKEEPPIQVSLLSEKNKEETIDNLENQSIEEEDETDQILQAVYVNMSYIYLCQQEPTLALRSANELASLSSCTKSNRYLAKVYAAEAHCMLSQIGEAMRTFRDEDCPPEFKSSSLLEAHSSTKNVNATLAKTGFYCNLATVNILQRNIPEAEKCIWKAFEIDPECREALRLLLYILVSKNSYTKAVQVLKDLAIKV